MTAPILYQANEQDFDSLGLGVLVDVLECKVIEGRNNNFELEMTYPIEGGLFEELKADRLIKADAGNDLKNQRFKIVRMLKQSNNRVKVYADHVSYHADELQLLPEVVFSGDAETALVTWKNNLVDEHQFSVWSDIDTHNNGVWSIRNVDSARKALFGVTGSLLQLYGGEYRFDNYHISLYRNRGDDNGVLISYGKNLTELEQDERINNTYTSVYPFSVVFHEDGTEEVITLPEYYIDSEHVENFARRKILLLNLSEEEIDNVETLRSRTEQYIISNEIGVPTVNLRVKFLDLAKTIDYEEFKLIEEVNLCDWVTVYFEKFDIYRRAKVIKIVWDVLLDRYDEIELGEARASLSRRVDVTPDDERIDNLIRYVGIVQMQANGKNKIFRGPDEPTGDLVAGDLWYRPMGSGGLLMFIYDGLAWSDEYMAGEGIVGSIDGQTTNLINLNAANIVSGTLDLSNGISVGYQDLPVLRANADGQVELNVSSLMINSFNPETDSVKREDLEYYFRYENGVVSIGEIGAEVVTEFANNRWAMVKNDEDLMFLNEDEINIQRGRFLKSMYVGNFGFIPRDNGSLSFGKRGED